MRIVFLSAIPAGAGVTTVAAAVVSDGRELQVEVEITPGRANKARMNRSPVTRPRDILGVLRTVLFAPEDLALVRGEPGEVAQAERLLDEAEELDRGDPRELGQDYLALRAALPALRVVGGCCGTDLEHVTAIADALV